MKLRIASIAFLLGSFSTGLAWLTLAPVLVRQMNTIVRLAPSGPDLEAIELTRGFLPFYLALDMLLVTIVCSAVLHVTVARPLRRMEQAIDRFGRLDLNLPFTAAAGPLVSRVQAALTRMAEALQKEQAITRSQLNELRLANERRIRAQTELVSAERLATVGKLAAGVAHEIGNPLGGILGYLALVKSRTVGSPDVHDCLERIDAEVQRINRIVRGLLDLGRPSRGTMSPVEIANLADTCVRLVGAGPDFIGVEVKVEVAPGTVARADPGPLSQVLINLLLNASHVLGGRGTIWLRAATIEGQAKIEIEDSGPGIADEVMPRLFEPFFTTRPAGQGTGLGLAVSMHLVSSMGGQLSARNMPGSGACFTIFLPAA